jgi:glycerol-3-phosphate dehydrogenase
VFGGKWTTSRALGENVALAADLILGGKSAHQGPNGIH